MLPGRVGGLRWYLLAGGLYLLLVVPFAHTTGAGESDSVALLAGLIQGRLTGEGLGWAGLYGVHFSFLYCAAMLPLAGRLDPSAFVLTANLISLAGGLASALLAVALLRRFVALPWAAAAALGFFATPATWPVWTYAHPFTLALPAALAAMLLLDAARRNSRARRTLYGLGAIAILAVAMGLRADVALILPAYASLLVWREGLTWRRVAALGLVATVALLGFTLLGRLLLPATDGLPVEPLSEIAGFMRTYCEPTSPLRGAVAWVVATGVGMSLLLLTALVAAWTSGRRRAVCAALLWLLPTAVFWLANPLPARHFFLSAAGAVVWSVLLLRDWLPVRPLAGLLAAAVVVSLVLPGPYRLLGRVVEALPPYDPLTASVMEGQVRDLRHWRHWQERWQRFDAEAPSTVILAGTWQDYAEYLLYQSVRGRKCSFLHPGRDGRRGFPGLSHRGRTVLWLETYSARETAADLGAARGLPMPVVAGRARVALRGMPICR